MPTIKSVKFQACFHEAWSDGTIGCDLGRHRDSLETALVDVLGLYVKYRDRQGSISLRVILPDSYRHQPWDGGVLAEPGPP